MFKNPAAPDWWYEAAQAYSDAGNEAMANLSTAELDYTVGNYQAAQHFAMLAQHKLPAGSPDWQRATDILAVAGTSLERHRRCGALDIKGES